MKMAKLYIDKSKDKEELQTYDKIISIFKFRIVTIKNYYGGFDELSEVWKTIKRKSKILY